MKKRGLFKGRVSLDFLILEFDLWAIKKYGNSDRFKNSTEMSSSCQPVAPSAPAMQNHLPHQLQQFQQQQQLQLPTPAVNHLALPQHQIQQEIRLMIESELSRAMNHQRTPTTHPSFESAPGHMESPDFKLA